MNEHTWKSGSHNYRAGKPHTLGDLTANHAVIQRQPALGGQWETIVNDPAVAEEVLRLASIAGKSSGKR
jgi:hypothetical protein